MQGQKEKQTGTLACLKSVWGPVADLRITKVQSPFILAPCGCFGGEGVAVDGSGRVSSPPLAGAGWFVGSPVVVALVSSGGGGCRWRR